MWTSPAVRFAAILLPLYFVHVPPAPAPPTKSSNVFMELQDNFHNQRDTYGVTDLLGSRGPIVIDVLELELGELQSEHSNPTKPSNHEYLKIKEPFTKKLFKRMFELIMQLEPLLTGFMIALTSGTYLWKYYLGNNKTKVGTSSVETLHMKAQHDRSSEHMSDFDLIEYFKAVEKGINILNDSIINLGDDIEGSDRTEDIPFLIRSNDADLKVNLQTTVPTRDSLWQLKPEVIIDTYIVDVAKRMDLHLETVSVPDTNTIMKANIPLTSRSNTAVVSSTSPYMFFTPPNSPPLEEAGKPVTVEQEEAGTPCILQQVEEGIPHTLEREEETQENGSQVETEEEQSPLCAGTPVKGGSVVSLIKFMLLTPPKSAYMETTEQEVAATVHTLKHEERSSKITLEQKEEGPLRVKVDEDIAQPLEQEDGIAAKTEEKAPAFSTPNTPVRGGSVVNLIRSFFTPPKSAPQEEGTSHTLEQNEGTPHIRDAEKETLQTLELEDWVQPLEGESDTLLTSDEDGKNHEWHNSHAQENMDEDKLQTLNQEDICKADIQVEAPASITPGPPIHRGSMINLIRSEPRNREEAIRYLEDRLLNPNITPLHRSVLNMRLTNHRLSSDKTPKRMLDMGLGLNALLSPTKWSRDIMNRYHNHKS